MNKLILIAIIIFSSINTAIADNTVVQNINIVYPSVSSVVTDGGNLNTTIDPLTGQISVDLTPNFVISTNNAKGVIAEFSAKIDTTSGMYNSMSGNSANATTGTILLSNTTYKPTVADVDNALSSSAIPQNNPNVIGYQINFDNLTKSGNDIVFAQAGSTIASGLVMKKKGTATVLVTISNNSLINSKTYNLTTDVAGAYQSIIYCTVYEP